MNKLISLICTALVACALVGTTSGYMTNYRSVKHCIPVKEEVTDNCEQLCKAQSSIKDWVYPVRAQLDLTEDGKKQCCCKFDDLLVIGEKDQWYDKKFPEMNFINKLWVDPKKCSTILITFGTKEEKDAHNTMCKYLSRKIPLSMLELAEFIQVVSYLRSIEHKSRKVEKTLRKDYVPNFSADIQEIFEQSLDSLLDHKRDNYKPDPPFEVERIEKLTELTTSLRKSLDIDIVHKAFDELIISQVIVSILGARKFYTAINQTIPGDSFQSLLGNNGLELPLDPRTMNIADFSCEKFKAASDILTHLIQCVHTALKSLKAEGALQGMAQNWTPFYHLTESAIVYNKLIEWRCTTGADKPAEIEFRAPEQYRARPAPTPKPESEEYHWGKYSKGVSVGGLMFSG